MQHRLHSTSTGLGRPLLFATGAIVVLALAGLGWPERNDYTQHAQAGVEALRHGDVMGFLRNGNVEAGSFLLRAPFVLLGDLFGGGSHAAYRMLAVPGLLATVALAVALWRHAQAGGERSRGPLLALLLIAASPFLLSSLRLAHPEEPLGAVLCLAALCMGVRQRWLLASLLMGLALGNKLWAVVAIVPLLIVLERRRIGALMVMGATAAIVYAPFVLTLLLSHDPDRVAGSTGRAGHVVSSFQPLQAVHGSGSFKPWQVWWYLGDSHHLHPETYAHMHPLYRNGPAWLDSASHPIAVLVPIALCAALAPLLRRRPRGDVLLALAVALLLRGMLDVGNNVYYELPFVFTLATWEVVARHRRPLLTLGATVTGWTIMTLLPLWISPEAQAVAYLLWSLPLLAGLLVALVSPQTATRLARGLRPRHPVAAALVAGRAGG
jgi:hypothetical protein